jgi:hypothetical protein
MFLSLFPAEEYPFVTFEKTLKQIRGGKRESRDIHPKRKSNRVQILPACALLAYITAYTARAYENIE